MPRYTGTTQRYTGGGRYAGGGRYGGVPRYTGQPTPVPVSKPKKKGRGFLGDLARYSGAEFTSNLAKDVGETAVGVVPGIYSLGKHVENLIDAEVHNDKAKRQKAEKNIAAVGTGLVKSYRDYYGHDVLHHLYR